jgi:putative methanogenesis marker protein 8
MSRHVMEALGKSRVVIEDGKVVEVSEPAVRYCPLFKKYRNIDELNCKSIKENMEFRIKDFGMCTENREVRLDYFLSFGISEVLSLAVKERVLEAAVIASDGCGTAVLDDPEIIQGMGGRISAIIETEPVKKVIEEIGADRILDAETADIDQDAGLEKAFSMGYSKVGVTTASAEQAARMRRKYGDRVMIFGVHTTGITEEEAVMFFDNADVITACASLHVREVAKTRATLQAGTKVPIYGATSAGADLMMMKLAELGKKPDDVLTDGPSPLI